MNVTLQQAQTITAVAIAKSEELGIYGSRYGC